MTEPVRHQDEGFVAIQIGYVNVDCEGKDEYVLVSRRSREPLTPEDAHAWLRPLVYCDTYVEAGGYFCHTVLVVQAAYSETEVIATVQHRYDI